MYKLKPIETRYNGILFRSRIEARWALFYDKLRIPYEYEREGYDVAGRWYLPDFWMPQQDCFIEIKGKCPDLEEEAIASTLSQGSGKTVHIFYGSLPDVGWYAGWNVENPAKFGSFTYGPDRSCESGYLWRLSDDEQTYEIGPFDLQHNSATNELVFAYHVSRSARFNS